MAVQTDPVQIFSAEESVVIIPSSTQVQFFGQGHSDVTAMDHNYTLCPSSETKSQLTASVSQEVEPSVCVSVPIEATPTPVFSSTPRKHTRGKLPVSNNCEQEVEDTHCIDTSAEQPVDHDVSWNPAADDITDSEPDGSGDTESEEESHSDYSWLQQDKKFVVFEENLEKLLYLTACATCRSPVCSIRQVVTGCNVTYHIQYLCQHGNKVWSASPYIGSGKSKVSAGNILACAATLFSGLTYSRIKKFCRVFNLEMVSQATYYEAQQELLIPVVNQTWLEHKRLLHQDLKDAGGGLTLCGDGRCDSPGFCAKYCTYSLMNHDDKKIVDFELVQVTQTGSSQSMEKYGFCKVLDRVREGDLCVETVVTDRHVGIKSVMRKEYVGINHQFDVYHIANTFRKKLAELCKRKKHAALAPWVKSIVNHVWFSSRMCDGNPDKLVELFTSICFHVSGKHEWRGYDHVSKCLHAPYSPAQQKKKAWLKGATLQAVKDIVFDPRLLRDIRQISLFCHTGSLENFHSSLLVYCPKRQEFDYAAMLARSQLAVLHHNNNVGREQAVVQRQHKSTASIGTARFKPEWKKQSAAWRVRPVYQPTSDDHILDMVVEVMKVKADGIILPQVQKPHAKNIAKITAPDKEGLIKKHVDRFEAAPKGQ